MSKTLKDKTNLIPPLTEGEMVEGRIIGFGLGPYINLLPKETALFGDFAA